MFDTRMLRGPLDLRGPLFRATAKALASGLLPLVVALLGAFLLDRFAEIQTPLLLLLLAVCYSALSQVPGAGFVSVLATFGLSIWVLQHPASLPLMVDNDVTTTLYLLAGVSALVLLLGAYRGLRRESSRELEQERRRSAEAQSTLYKVLDRMGPHMFVALMDTEGRIVDVNRPALALSDSGIEALRGRPLPVAGWWDHDPAMVQAMADAVARARLGDSTRFDAIAEVADGRRLHLDCSIHPLPDEDGNVSGIVASAMSVDEREKARRRAQDLLEILETHFDAAPLACISFDNDLRVLRWSSTAARFWGQDADTICGLSASELPFLPAPERARLAEDLGALIAGEADTGSRELSSLGADGRPLEGEWFYSRVTPADDGTYVLCMVNDATARKRAARERDHSERLFRGVFDQAAVGIVLVDDKARLGQSNQAFREMTGYSETEIARLDYCAITDPEDQAQARTLADKFTEHGLDSYSIEQRFKRKDGESIWVKLFVSRLPETDEGRERYIAVAQDIDQRVRAVQNYQRLSEELEAVVAERTRALERTSQRWRERNTALLRLNEASSLLSSSRSAKEVADIAARYVPQIFPGTSGAIYLSGRHPGDILQQSACWGDIPELKRPSLEISDCWALRRGQLHSYAPDQATAPACAHMADSRHASHCLPIMVGGQATGLLTIEYAVQEDTPEDDTAADLTLLRALNEQMGLALANLRLNEDLREQAIRDPLTGLFNRRWFEEEVARLLAHAKRHETPLSLLIMDIDHFKQVNDEHGHTVGDDILCRVARRMQTEMRAGDLAARHGGEEFVIALPGHDSTAAIRVAERLRSVIMSTTANDPDLPGITVSIGIAAYPADGRSYKAIVKHADDALYEAKRRGRNQVHVHGMTVARALPLGSDS